MERAVRRDVLATLIKAGRRDLAYMVAKVVPVGHLFDVMLPKMVKLDVRLKKNEMKRGAVNYYRMSHWNEALERAKKGVEQHLGSTDPEAFEALKRALQREFEPDFPPLKATLKEIDKQLQQSR